MCLQTPICTLKENTRTLTVAQQTLCTSTHYKTSPSSISNFVLFYTCSPALIMCLQTHVFTLKANTATLTIPPYTLTSHISTLQDESTKHFKRCFVLCRLSCKNSVFTDSYLYHREPFSIFFDSRQLMVGKMNGRAGIKKNKNERALQ